MQVTRSDLARLLSDPDSVLHRVTGDISAKTASFKTGLLVPTEASNRETERSFVEHLMPAHADTKANEAMNGTVIKNGSDATEYKPKPAWTSVVKPPSDMTGEMERTKLISVS